MHVSDGLLLTAAGAFAVINGINDGGALVATAVRIPSVRPIGAIGVLTGAVIVAPLALSTQVATTLAEGLVSFGVAGERFAILAAVTAAVGTVLALSARGLPTSLTLALVGAILGAGVGAGLPVSWGAARFVLLMGLVSPIVGALGGYILSRLAGTIRSANSASRDLARTHQVVYTAQCLAYATNDGQKMFAIFAVAMGSGASELTFPPILAIGMLFLVGSVCGMRRIGAAVGSGLLSVRPLHAVASETSSAGVAFASAGLGAPVSMTQSIIASLVGAGLAETPLKVRWQVVSRLLLAWLITLPSALLLALPLGLLTRIIS